MNKEALKQLVYPTFLLAIFCFVIMMVLYFIGNPRLGGFYWHFVPEMFGVYFIGMWTVDIKWNFKEVFGIYCLTTFLVPLLRGSVQIMAFVLSAIIGFPMVIGYYMCKQNLKDSHVDLKP